MKPVVIDLFCGLGGWSEGFLAAGYHCIGFDIERHDYGSGVYPGELVLQDVHAIHGSQFRNATCIVSSPPCQEFSYMAMPWKRAKLIAQSLRVRDEHTFPEGYTGSRTPAELTALFDACFRIQREACEAAGRHIPLIVENVKGAQPWVGPAKANYGSFFLWGDIGMANGNIVLPGVLKPGCFLRAPGRGRKVEMESWSNYGKPGYVGQGFNVEAVKAGRKVPGLNFHEHEKTGKPGRSFQSAAVEGLKVPGIKLSEVGFNVAARNALGDIPKPDGYQRSDEEKRQHIGHARKAASAQIAKIPLALSSFIARSLKPESKEAAA